MRFLTTEECAEWLQGVGRSRPSEANSAFYERVRFPKEIGGLYWFARQISAALMHSREPCLLWMEEWGIWDQNLHLYYRVRESYGDSRLLHQAPGHFFLGYECEDLATILQISMLNGWGGLLLTHLGMLEAFFSHDEFLDVYSNNEIAFRDLLKTIAT